jgi:hypothetical protein
MWLLIGSCEAFAIIVADIPSWISDYGTEIGIARIQPISIREIFPFMTDEDQDPGGQDVCDRAAPAEEIDFAAPERDAMARQEVDFAAPGCRWTT